VCYLNLKTFARLLKKQQYNKYIYKKRIFWKNMSVIIVGGVFLLLLL